MREQDEELGAFVSEQPESPTLGRTLNDTYLTNCSSWQLASIRTGRGFCVLNILIDSKHPSTSVQWCVGMWERLGRVAAESFTILRLLRGSRVDSLVEMLCI